VGKDQPETGSAHAPTEGKPAIHVGPFLTRVRKALQGRRVQSGQSRAPGPEDWHEHAGRRHCDRPSRPCGSSSSCSAPEPSRHAGEAEVLFEGRRATAADEVLHGRFEALEVHVYRL